MRKLIIALLLIAAPARAELLAYNLTNSPVTLAAGTCKQLAANASAPTPVKAYNVTGCLRALSAANYDSLEAQRPATVKYVWTGEAEYSTVGTTSILFAYSNSIRPSATYGDGSDGTNTGVCCGTLSGNCTLARNVYCRALVTGANTVFVTSGSGSFRLFATEYVLVSTSGAISAAGANAVTTTGGVGTAAGLGNAGGIGGSAAGGNGSCSSGSQGGTGSNITGTGGGLFGIGGAGGSGGNAGAGVAGGPGTATSSTLFHVFPVPLYGSIIEQAAAAANIFQVIGGGSGAGGGASAGSDCGGGGGASGGVVLLAAPMITVNGTIDLRGGAGANGGGSNSGGGGGGGAGGAWITHSGSPFSAATLAKILLTAGSPGAGVGSGAAGSAGAAGTLVETVHQ